jgi:hypothetical protein
MAKNIKATALELNKKPMRICKQVFLEQKLHDEIQAELDKIKNVRGVSLKWQTMLEACCIEFLRERRESPVIIRKAGRPRKATYTSAQ